MATKKEPINSNINKNINNVNVNVDVHQHKKTSDKGEEPNWYIRTILGGIIALVLTLGGYYAKKNLDYKSKANSTEITPGGELVQPNN
jgi:hypothetical protein